MIPMLFLAFSWGGLVFLVVGGGGLIVAQGLLPLAREAIQRNPPTGPEWARWLWYERARVYGALLALALAAGGVAALLAGLQFS